MCVCVYVCVFDVEGIFLKSTVRVHMACVCLCVCVCLRCGRDIFKKHSESAYGVCVFVCLCVYVCVFDVEGSWMFAGTAV